MKQLLLAVVLVLCASSQASAKFPFRAYRVGQVLHYEMRGLNDGWVYRAQSRHEVKRTKYGAFYEEVTWTALWSNGKKIDLSALKNFRQRVSLDRNFKFTKADMMRDVARVPPKLMRYVLGPYFDLTNFYVDANPQLFYKKLKKLEAGATIVFPHGTPSSWANGHTSILGQSCIDFRVAYQDAGDGPALLMVDHISPKNPKCLYTPEKWMKKRVGRLRNNWVGVFVKKKDGATKYTASYGLEFIGVHVYLDRKTGIIKAADMHNPVQRKNRVCKSVKMAGGKITAIKGCAPPTNFHTFRNISLRLMGTRSPH